MQKFNIGDKVTFLNDVGGGEVVKLLPKNIYMVLTDDGFEYPMPAVELVFISAGERKKEKFVETEIVLPKKIKEEEPQIIKEIEPRKEYPDVNISLAFLPANNSEEFQEELEVYIINDSNYNAMYHIIKHDDTGINYLDADVLEAGVKSEIGKIDREQINTLQKLRVQLILFGHKKDVVKEVIDKEFNFKPVKFYNNSNYKTSEFFDNNAYFVTLVDFTKPTAYSTKDIDNLKKIIAEKEESDKINQKENFKPRPKPIIKEVDLHINELLDSIIGMSNADILNHQLEVFHKEMTEAISKKYSKIVFIHGIGNGTLRDKLRKSIETQYKLQYQDASFKEYGFGATLIVV